MLRARRTRRTSLWVWRFNSSRSGLLSPLRRCPRSWGGVRRGGWATIIFETSRYEQLRYDISRPAFVPRNSNGDRGAAIILRRLRHGVGSTGTTPRRSQRAVARARRRQALVAFCSLRLFSCPHCIGECEDSLGTRDTAHGRPSPRAQTEAGRPGGIALRRAGSPEASNESRARSRRAGRVRCSSRDPCQSGDPLKPSHLSS